MRHGTLMPKWRQRPSSTMLSAFTLPSALYPAMWGVAIHALSMSRRLMQGSFSHVSITTSLTLLYIRASCRASLSTTAPRLVFIITGRRPRRSKKPSPARWYVGWGPSFVSGTWNVITSHCRSISSIVTNCPSSPRSCRGGSHTSTRIPYSSATSFTFDPTCPQPTMPIVELSRAMPFCLFSSRSTERTYCATEAALHPGQLIHSMPARRM